MEHPPEHNDDSNPAVGDNNGQEEPPSARAVDFGLPFEKIMPYVASENPSGSACTSTSPSPGITSYLVNAYFLFGATLAQVQEPTSTLYVAERNSQFCGVHEKRPASDGGAFFCQVFQAL